MDWSTGISLNISNMARSGSEMIANLQYGWTLFVNPLDQKYHWGKAAIQTAFFIFVLTETWLVPLEGYLVDRFGPKLVVMAGGLLVGLAWVMNSFAASLTVLYIAAAIGVREDPLLMSWCRIRTTSGMP
jgi:MFS family permease